MESPFFLWFICCYGVPNTPSLELVITYKDQTSSWLLLWKNMVNKELEMIEIMHT